MLAPFSKSADHLLHRVFQKNPNMSLKPSFPFASAPFERAAHHRTDLDWLASALKSSQTKIMFVHKGKFICTDNGVPLEDALPGSKISKHPRDIVWISPTSFPNAENHQYIFLGEENEIARFAINLPYEFELENSQFSEHVLGEIRSITGGISAGDAQYASTTAAVFNWHRKHSFCANCGTKTKIEEAGWKRVCPSCETEHFPRIDPVAIMLAVKGDQCLMGRQASWPEGMYSCLAGFVEPGETLEQAAARELFEEAGVIASGRVEYLFGQPWPFPTSLMIGMIMEVADGALNVDKNELETARWFSREEAQTIINGEHSEIIAPADMAIAHHVLKAWLESDKW